MQCGGWVVPASCLQARLAACKHMPRLLACSAEGGRHAPVRSCRAAESDPPSPDILARSLCARPCRTGHANGGAGQWPRRLWHCFCRLHPFHALPQLAPSIHAQGVFFLSFSLACSASHHPAGHAGAGGGQGGLWHCLCLPNTVHAPPHLVPQDTRVLVADKARDASGVAFAALVQAMLNQGQHAVLRLVRTAREVRALMQVLKASCEEWSVACAAPGAHGARGEGGGSAPSFCVSFLASFGSCLVLPVLSARCQEWSAASAAPGARSMQGEGLGVGGTCVVDQACPLLP